MYFENPKNADEIATQIAQGYEEHNTLAMENETYNKEGETNEKQQVTEEAGDNTTAPATVEGAYLCLYQQIFEPLGDAYDCRYNAKGNFYAVLSEGVGRPGDGEPEYSTAIRDIYAVNKNTGEVTASGKHAWADVGTEAYQQASGEM